MSKIAVALAGGGPLGGIYEVGALTALAESIPGFDPSEADILVGVSSGGFVAAAMANGLTPAHLAHMLMGKSADSVFDPEQLLRPALGEYFRRALSLPPLIWSALADYLADPLHQRPLESFQRLSQAIPTGVFDNAGINRILRELFDAPGRTNDFRELPHQLYVVATELDTGESIAFGSPGYDEIPISVAVQASAALPGLYPPVNIEGRDYVDGALIKTLHASVALKAGAELVFCVNPLVPYDAGLATRRGAPHHRLSDGGLPVVLSQTFRAIIHSRMKVGMDRYRHQYPKADVVLFEPTRDDGEMFFTNVFSYHDRQRLCEHAYQRTRQDLYRRRHELIPVLEKHGFRLDVAALKDHRHTLLPSEKQARHSALNTTLSALNDSLDLLQDWAKTRRVS